VNAAVVSKPNTRIESNSNPGKTRWQIKVVRSNAQALHICDGKHRCVLGVARVIQRYATDRLAHPHARPIAPRLSQGDMTIASEAFALR